MAWSEWKNAFEKLASIIQYYVRLTWYYDYGDRYNIIVDFTTENTSDKRRLYVYYLQGNGGTYSFNSFTKKSGNGEILYNSGANLMFEIEPNSSLVITMNYNHVWEGHGKHLYVYSTILEYE